MNQSLADVAVNPAEETIQMGPIAVRFLVSGADSSGSAAVFEMTVGAEGKLPGPAHSHDDYEETVYGLEGTLTWTVDGRAVEVGPSQALCIPRGVVHRFDNLGDQHVKALVVASPAKIGPEYFREMAAALTDANGGQPDPARMAEIQRRHGLTPVRPRA